MTLKTGTQYKKLMKLKGDSLKILIKINKPQSRLNEKEREHKLLILEIRHHY